MKSCRKNRDFEMGFSDSADPWHANKKLASMGSSKEEEVLKD